MKKVCALLSFLALFACLFGLSLCGRVSQKSRDYAGEYQLICLDYMRLNMKLTSPSQLAKPAYVHRWNEEVKKLFRRSQRLEPTGKQQPAQSALTSMLLNQMSNLNEIERYAALGNRKALGDCFLRLCDTMAYDLTQMRYAASKSGIDDLDTLSRLEFGISRFQI